MVDLEQFRAQRDDQLVPCKPKRPPRHKGREWFLRGPIPGAWLSQALKLSGRAIRVALALWYLAGVGKSRTVKPTWRTWSRFNIPPEAGRLGLG